MKVHFIGIGGIGISGLAFYYLKNKAEVSGSDLVASEITKRLEKEGAKIFIGHFKENISQDLDLVIYSLAIERNNPELKEAKKLAIKTISFPKALGKLTKKFFTIAICGTHGKTTTTALSALILERAGFEPTVFLGTKLKEFNNLNVKIGKGKYLLIEADEFKGAFLNYFPQIIILTNIEKEHLDYFKNLSRAIKTYEKFILKLKKGVLIYNKDDLNARKLAQKHRGGLIPFSLADKETKKIKKILKIPGKHNVLNALASLKLARYLKIPDKISFLTIGDYEGAWRRFQIKKINFKGKKITLISDYAHHPTEILATLNSAKLKFPHKKFWVIFQPHQYLRTFYLEKEFIKTFKKLALENFIKKIIITEIFEVLGREDKKLKKRITSEKLVKKIGKRKVIYLPKNKLFSFIEKNLNNQEGLLILGAGDIYRLDLKLAKFKMDS